MSTDVSPENEQYIASVVARGDFRDRSEVLNTGVELLRRRNDLVADVEAGTRQLENGDYHDYDREGLHRLFDRIKAEGRSVDATQQAHG